MSSSKAKAKARSKSRRQAQDAADASPGSPGSQRSVVYIAIAVLALFAGVTVVLLFAGFQTPPELAPARKALQAALAEDEPAKRKPFVEEARRVANQCDYHGVEPDAAKLLGLVAGGMQPGVRDVQLPRDCDLSNVTQADLKLASTALVEYEHWQLADKVLTQWRKLEPANGEALEMAAAAKMALGENSDATSLCQQLIAKDPENPAPWKMLAMIFEQRGLTLQLVDIYRKIIELAPTDAEPYQLRLVESLTQTGDLQAARETFDSLGASKATLEGVDLVEAQLLRVEGESAKALSKVNRALVSEPQNTKALKLKAQLLQADNGYNQAVALLSQVVELAPYDEEAHFLLGQAHAALRNQDASEKHLRIHHRLKSSQITIKQLEAIVRRNPRDKQVLEQLAELHEVTGNFERSKKYRAAADRLPPGG